MSQNPTQALGLRESRLDSTLSTEPLQITEAAGGHNHSRQQDARQIETAGKRAAALIGQGVLQLPIWGFAMTYGVYQEYYSSNWTLEGSVSGTGVIGTTQNGVMYISMPFLFALFSRRWASWRRTAAIAGIVLACASFLLSSYSKNVWHLILTQGVLAAFGCALIYSPTTLTLGEWFSTSNRALAYGIILSSKNIVGSTCPFLMRHLLDVYGFRVTLRIWAAVLAGSACVAIYLIPVHPSSRSSASAYRPRKLPWSFLRHRTFWLYSIATMLQSSGYGIPQTYINTYASNVTTLSPTASTLLLTLFNLPGIISSSFFGYLNDGKRLSLSASTVATISAVSSALSAFFLWGFASQHNTAMVLLTLFSITFGFFAGGYSATWGGMIDEMENEAASRNEAIDTGVLYGLLNGARGIGYVSGGLAGVPLVKAGAQSAMGGFAYGTAYGPLIVFTGLCSIFGGWSSLWRCSKFFR